MARLVLTNNKNKFEKAICRNVNAGFDDYTRYSLNDVFLSVHKKRIQKIDNFLEMANGDFCSVVGTCIYKNSIGKEALKSIYDDFNGDIEQTRENALGNYLMAIRKNNKIFVFVDKYQIIKTFYFNTDNDWFITNSLADIGNVLDNIQVNEFAFMQETMLLGTIGTHSLFKNVFRLFGFQFITINGGSQKTFSIVDLPYSRVRRDFSRRTIESAVDEYAEIIQSKFEPVARVFGDNLAIHQTGGLDNRTVFSAFMNLGCKPRIMYGVGNSVLTNTKNEDLSICKEYQNKFDLDFHEMNWREDFIDAKKHWPNLFERYGFNFNIYGGSRAFFNEYEGNIKPYPKFMEFGYFLENLRLREYAMNKGTSRFYVEDFVADYLFCKGYGNLTQSMGFYQNFEGLKKYTSDTIKRFMNLYEIGVESSFTLNDFDQVRWIHSRNCDSVLVNFVNEFAPSIAMFSLPELHEFPFDLPASWRANGKFQLMLINKLYPKALDIPIFSHCRKQHLDKNNFRLTPQYSLPELAAKKLKEFGVPESLYKQIASFYKNFTLNTQIRTNQEESMALKEYLVPIIKKHSLHLETPVSPEAYTGSIVYLMIFAQYLFGISMLKAHHNGDTGKSES